MNMRPWMLRAYSVLLRLYPPPFRKRFAAEMLELASAAEPGEWPLIFGDTALAILRSRLSTAVVMPSEAPAHLGALDSYAALGDSPLNVVRLLQGFVLAAAILVGLWYVSSLRYWEPAVHYSDCAETPSVAASSRNAP
jgi:hypothetical protein